MDSVKRPHRPNILLKRVPLLIRNTIFNKVMTFKSTPNNNVKKSELMIAPAYSPSDEIEKDAIFLPSKEKDRKSEITLLPLKRKWCGHYEPCESIVCDVVVQQHVDQDRISPILAVNIEENEINALVTKHCEDDNCDALNIDHNRCRRAVIKLYKCDIFSMCDICEMILKEWKSRLQHKNCTRKNEYKHNDVNYEHLWKDKLRIRECQLLEASKMKRNDYLNSVKNDDLAMEILKKNKELIITPRTVANKESVITVTSVPSTQVPVLRMQSTVVNTPSSVSRPVDINLPTIKNVLPYVITSQCTTLLPGSKLSSENKTQMNQVKFPIAQQSPHNPPKQTSVQITRMPTLVPASPTIVPTLPTQCSYVRLTTPTSSPSVVPITINNWFVSTTPVVTNAPIQTNNSLNVLKPMRVVPIVNLKSPPSLLHSIQGIPKFCIMAESSSIKPGAISSPPPLQPITVTVASTKIEKKIIPKVAISPFRDLKVQSKKLATRLKKKKLYFCVHCSKHFSTDWYFKLHVAKHKEKFYCKFCKKSFINLKDMKKHMMQEHKAGKEHGHDGKPSTSVKSEIEQTPIADKTDVEVAKHENDEREVERDSTYCKEQQLVNEINRLIELTNDSSKVDIKMLKCEDTLGASMSEERSVCIKKELDIPDNFEFIEGKAESVVNQNDNAIVNGLTLVSSEADNINSDDFVQETNGVSR